MDSATEILKRVRRVEIKAKRMASETFAGGYQSSFRGQGLDFDDFREYLAGDEPRFIDWKVTARMGSPYVRKFREEREISLILAVDVSASMEYGSQSVSKLEFAAELAAVLAFSAQQTGDKFGLLLFGRGEMLFLPPGKGYKQVLRIVREILEAPESLSSSSGSATGASSSTPSMPSTLRAEESRGRVSFGDVSTYLLQALRKRSLVIMLSDFMFPPDKVALGKLNFKHEFLGIRLNDPAECELPNAGLVLLKDAETGEMLEVNLDNPDLRVRYAQAFDAHGRAWKTLFGQQNADYLPLRTDEDYMMPLRKLFSTRTKRFVH